MHDSKEAVGFGRPTSAHSALKAQDGGCMYQDVSLFIDGSWSKAAGGKTSPVLNPATGEEIGTFAHAAKSDLERAVQAADKGFKAWRKVSAMERYKIMRKAGELLRQRVDAIAKILTLEQGKPVGEAKLEILNG